MCKENKIEKILSLQKRINDLMHDKYHELAQKYGLSLEQYHLLVELEELMLDVEGIEEAPSVSGIAENVNNSQNTVSERISRLEKKGLVRRVKDERDRRISRVILTEDGKRLMEDISKEAGSKFLYESVYCMEDQMVEYLYKSMKALVNVMEQKDGNGEDHDGF